MKKSNFVKTLLATTSIFGCALLINNVAIAKTTAKSHTHHDTRALTVSSGVVTSDANAMDAHALRLLGLLHVPNTATESDGAVLITDHTVLTGSGVKLVSPFSDKVLTDAEAGKVKQFMADVISAADATALITAIKVLETDGIINPLTSDFGGYNIANGVRVALGGANVTPPAALDHMVNKNDHDLLSVYHLSVDLTAKKLVYSPPSGTVKEFFLAEKISRIDEALTDIKTAEPDFVTKFKAAQVSKGELDALAVSSQKLAMESARDHLQKAIDESNLAATNLDEAHAKLAKVEEAIKVFREYEKDFGMFPTSIPQVRASTMSDGIGGVPSDFIIQALAEAEAALSPAVQTKVDTAKTNILAYQAARYQFALKVSHLNSLLVNPDIGSGYDMINTEPEYLRIYDLRIDPNTGNLLHGDREILYTPAVKQIDNALGKIKLEDQALVQSFKEIKEVKEHIAVLKNDAWHGVKKLDQIAVELEDALYNADLSATNTDEGNILLYQIEQADNIMHMVIDPNAPQNLRPETAVFDTPAKRAHAIKVIKDLRKALARASTTVGTADPKVAAAIAKAKIALDHTTLGFTTSLFTELENKEKAFKALEDKFNVHVMDILDVTGGLAPMVDEDGHVAPRPALVPTDYVNTVNHSDMVHTLGLAPTDIVISGTQVYMQITTANPDGTIKHETNPDGSKYIIQLPGEAARVLRWDGDVKNVAENKYLTQKASVSAVIQPLKDAIADTTSATSIKKAIADLEAEIARTPATVDTSLARSKVAEAKATLQLAENAVKTLTKESTEITPVVRAKRLVPTPVSTPALNAAMANLKTAADNLKTLIDTGATVSTGYEKAWTDYKNAISRINDFRLYSNVRLRPAPLTGETHGQFIRDNDYVNKALFERRGHNISGAWATGSFPISESDLEATKHESYGSSNIDMAFGYDQKIGEDKTIGGFFHYAMNDGKGRHFKQEKTAFVFGAYAKYQWKPDMYFTEKVSYNSSSYENKVNRSAVVAKSTVDLSGLSNEFAMGYKYADNILLEGYLNTIMTFSGDFKRFELGHNSGLMNATANFDSSFYNAIGARGFMNIDSAFKLSEIQFKPFANGYMEFALSGKDLEGKYTQLGIVSTGVTFEENKAFKMGLSGGVSFNPSKEYKDLILTTSYSFNYAGNTTHALNMLLNLKM